MKVLVLHPSDELYGADKVLLQAVRALCHDGHRVRVLLPTDVDYPAHRACRELASIGAEVEHARLPILRRRYVSVKGFAQLGFTVFRAFAPLWREIVQADVVYVNTSAALPAALPCFFLRSRSILHLHEYWRASDRVVLGVLARLLTERVIAVSQAVTEPLPTSLRRRSVVVYNGLPDLPSEPDPVRSGSKTTFLVASRWNTWKGHETLARAWAEGIPDCELIICGGPPPAGEGVDVHRLFAGASGVTFVGEIDAIDEYIRGASAVVVPSEQPDPLPTIAIEALRGSRAVIGTNRGGLPEIIMGASPAGWLFEPFDHLSLRRILASVTRKELAARGAAARNTFLARFNIEQFEREMLRVILGVQSERR